MLWDLITKYANDDFGLPYSFIASSHGDGALPSEWKGSSTMQLSGGLITNNPGYTDVGLTDGDLEATYTAGKCASLTKGGSPTLTEETSDVYHGSKAQGATGAAVNNYLYYGAKAALANTFYRFRCFVKGSGTNLRISAYHAQGLPATQWYYPYDSASAYTQRSVSMIVNANGNIICYPFFEAGASSFQAGLMDYGFLDKLITADVMAGLPVTNRLATVKVQPYTTGGKLVDGTLSYIWHWGNAQDLPTTYLAAYWIPYTSGSYFTCGLLKNVNGTWTELISEGAKTLVADAWLEIRPVDNTHVALYYNNVQAGANIEVTDVPGAFAGLGITGGNAAQSFFVG